MHTGVGYQFTSSQLYSGDERDNRNPPGMLEMVSQVRMIQLDGEDADSLQCVMM